MLSDSIFHHKQNGLYSKQASYTGLSGQLLLAAFLKHMQWQSARGWSGACPNAWKLGQTWDSCELLHSCVVLNKGVCGKLPFILASSSTCEAHNSA